MDEFDRSSMHLALELARQGEGHVEPNPMVGCVLVRGQEIIGRGFHRRYGGPHAEVEALSEARNAGRDADLKGCTAYVTLEPCCHHGKTPPCTLALIEAGVSRAVIAMQDPFDQVAGKGAEALRTGGIEVEVGLLADQARELNAPYLKRIQSRRPWVIAKWAMSVDGKIAATSGESQWISNADSRQRVHQIRGRVDAVLVGSRTALRDDPLLTTRTESAAPRVATRIVVDSKLALSTTSRLATTAREAPVMIWAGPEADLTKAKELRRLGIEVVVSTETQRDRRLIALLEHLAVQRSATNVLVEGGEMLLGSLLDLRQIDQCEVFVAPKLIGGANAPSPIGGIGSARVEQGPEMRVMSTDRLRDDLHISLRLGHS